MELCCQEIIDMVNYSEENSSHLSVSSLPGKKNAFPPYCRCRMYIASCKSLRAKPFKTIYNRIIFSLKILYSTHFSVSSENSNFEISFNLQLFL